MIEYTDSMIVTEMIDGDPVTLRKIIFDLNKNVGTGYRLKSLCKLAKNRITVYDSEGMIILDRVHPITLTLSLRAMSTILTDSSGNPDALSVQKDFNNALMEGQQEKAISVILQAMHSMIIIDEYQCKLVKIYDASLRGER